MKSFRKIETYEGAKKFFCSQGFNCPFNKLDDEEKEKQGESYLAFVETSFHNAKNAAVRAAIHKELLGESVTTANESLWFGNWSEVIVARLVDCESGKRYGYGIVDKIFYDNYETD